MRAAAGTPAIWSSPSSFCSENHAMSGKFEQWRERRERARTAAIVDVLRVAGPRESDAQRRLVLRPAQAQRRPRPRWQPQDTAPRRECCVSSDAAARRRPKAAAAGKSCAGNASSARTTAATPGARREYLRLARPAPRTITRAPLSRKRRRKAHELQRVAQALLGGQAGACVRRGLRPASAVPADVSAAPNVSRAMPPLVLAPALGVIDRSQAAPATGSSAPARSPAPARSACRNAAIASVQIVRGLQRQAQVVPRGRQVGLSRQRLPIVARWRRPYGRRRRAPVPGCCGTPVPRGPARRRVRAAAARRRAIALIMDHAEVMQRGRVLRRRPQARRGSRARRPRGRRAGAPACRARPGRPASVQVAVPLSRDAAPPTAPWHCL